MLGKHLPERFHKVRIRLFHGTADPASIKLPTPMPSYPFSNGSVVYRPENWTVFGDVNCPKPLSGSQCGGGTLHRSNKLIRPGQFVLAPFADKQVFFDLFEIGVGPQSESVGF